MPQVQVQTDYHIADPMAQQGGAAAPGRNQLAALDHFPELLAEILKLVPQEDR